MKMKEESEKGGLKLSIHKAKIMESSPITSRQIEGEKVKVVTDFIFFLNAVCYLTYFLTTTSFP